MIPGVRRVCLSCGTLTLNGSRCEPCQTTQDTAISNRRGPRAHYAGDYRKRAKVIRDNAETCWICGDGYRVDDPWTADHLVPGDPASPLAAAHRSCNSARGNKKIISTA
jgi:hypothetical protein